MIDLFLKNLWLWKCDLPELEINTKIPEYNILKVIQWNDLPIELAKNRAIQSAFRYGLVGKRKNYNRVEAIKRKADLYQITGNLENLADIITYCVSEFTEGDHPLKHFKSIDDEEHCKKFK